MDEGRPLGARRLIEDVQRHDPSPMFGVAIFATPGTNLAVIEALNVALPYPRRQVAAVNARTAAGGLPLVVALVVNADGVTVYPTTTRAEINGPPVTRWPVGDFRAATYRPILSIQLTVLLRSGERFALETKSFPVGPNRFNRRVTRMIVEMGRRGDGVPVGSSL